MSAKNGCFQLSLADNRLSASPPIAAFPERFFHKEKRRLMEALLAQKIGVSFAAGFYPSLAVSEL